MSDHTTPDHTTPPPGQGRRAEKKGVNIRDIAAAAGVSVATVSRVLNPAPAQQIRPETRQRVLDAVERFSYRPNDLARALLHRTTRTVGLLIPDISNPYYPGLVRGVEDGAAQRDYRVVLCNTDRDTEKTAIYLNALVKSRVDGIIVAGGTLEAAFSPDEFTAYDTRVAVVGRHDLPYPSVRIDNELAARRAVEHLVGLGHRDIAMIAGPLVSSTVRDRVSGYRAALADHGLDADDSLLAEADFQEEGGYWAADRLIGREPRPTAIVAASDRMAVGAAAALTDAGLRIPGDLSLVGFDDTPLASYLRPALTSVSLPAYELGATALRLLLDDDPHPTPQMLPTRLVVRESCAAPPARSG